MCAFLAIYEWTIKIIDYIGCAPVQMRINSTHECSQHGSYHNPFVKGSFKGVKIDNTTETEVSAWLELIGKIRPSLVMIYTIARDTPVETLVKVSLTDLNKIAARIEAAGFNVQVSG